MGIFFVVPLYLQIVLGLDGLDTGIRMLPASITMLIVSAMGARLVTRFSVRAMVRAGLVTTAVAILGLLDTIDPTLDSTSFAVFMALLGIGMGLIVSQLGNVVQSSVDASGRGEAGGWQYTSAQLGSSMGVALIGAIVLAGLSSVFVSTIQADERIEVAVSEQIGLAAGTGIGFVPTGQLESAAQAAGLDAPTTIAIEVYEAAQLQSLKAGLLAAAFLVLITIPFTRELPHDEPAPATATAHHR
ncbi:MAG: MFS transporter [Candidatus Nanopelagicales bacterium]